MAKQIKLTDACSCDLLGINGEAYRISMQYILNQYEAAKTDAARNAWAHLGMKELSELSNRGEL